MNIFSIFVKVIQHFFFIQIFFCQLHNFKPVGRLHKADAIIIGQKFDWSLFIESKCSHSINNVHVCGAGVCYHKKCFKYN